MNDSILKFRRYEDVSLAYTSVNRQTSDIRIGLMDSIVPIEALVTAETYPPVRGCLSVAKGCPCAAPNLRRRFIFNGLPTLSCPMCNPIRGCGVRVRSDRLQIGNP